MWADRSGGGLARPTEGTDRRIAAASTPASIPSHQASGLAEMSRSKCSIVNFRGVRDGRSGGRKLAAVMVLDKSKTLIHRVRHTVICLKTTQCTGHAAPSDVLCYGNTRRYGRQATMTLIHLSRKGL